MPTQVEDGKGPAGAVAETETRLTPGNAAMVAWLGYWLPVRINKPRMARLATPCKLAEDGMRCVSACAKDSEVPSFAAHEMHPPKKPRLDVNEKDRKKDAKDKKDKKDKKEKDAKHAAAVGSKTISDMFK